MKYRKGIAAVVFRRKGQKKGTKGKSGRADKLEFLILHRIQNWRGWEFPKGGCRRGESESACLRREMFEETGTKKFGAARKADYRIKYRWPQSYEKDHCFFNGVDNRLYVVEFLGKKIKLDEKEHDCYLWLNPEKTLKKLTYKNQRDAFKFALKLLGKGM